MDKKLKITIEVDSKTKELKMAQGDFDKLSKSIHDVGINLKQFGNISDTVVSGLFKYDMFKTAFLEIGSAIKKSIEIGIKYNASLEQMRIGIASLLAVQEKAVNKNFKFSAALQQSQQVMQLLKKANLETSATLQELTQGFQAALAPAMQAGLNIKQTVEYTKLMTQAAGAMGVPMNQLAQELKSVVSGTIDLNSVVATNLGITNEQIRLHKKQGDLFEFLKKKLEAFAMAGNAVQDSFSGVISNLEDSWSEFLGLLSKPAFDELKSALKDLTDQVKEWTAAIQEARVEEKKWFETKTIDEVKIKANALVEEINELKRKLNEDDGFMFFGLSEAEKTQIKARIKFLEQRLYLLGKHTKEILANSSAIEINIDRKKKLTEEEKKLISQLEKETKIISDNAYERLTQKYQEMLAKYKGVSGAKFKIDKWYYAELAKLNKKAMEEFAKSQEAALDKKEQAYLTYLESVGKKEEAFWLKEGKKINELLLQGLDQKQALEIVQADYKNFTEKISKNLKKSAKDAAKYTETIFDKMSTNIYDSLNSNFFDAITGKFEDFKSFLRNLFRDILSGIITPFAKSLSSTISAGLMGVVGVPAFSGVDIAKELAAAGWKALGNGAYQNTIGQKVVVSSSGLVAYDASGNPIADISSVAGLPSSLATAAKGGVFLAHPLSSAGGFFVNQGSALYAAGHTTLGGLATGMGNWFAGGTPLGTAQAIGYYGGGALVGTGMGYGVGKLGDMLFGADTRAGMYGAIGGSLGAVLGTLSEAIGGPLGALIGSLIGSAIGGLFGKWKLKETGFGIDAPISIDDMSGLHGYIYKRKKSWFHNKKDKRFPEIDSYVKAKVEAKIQALESYIDSIAGNIAKADLVLGKGKFEVNKKNNEFTEYLSKKFLTKILGIDKAIDHIAVAAAKEGLHVKIGVAGAGEWSNEALLLIEHYAKSRLGYIDKALKDGLITEVERTKYEKLQEVYEAWKSYAKEKEQDVSDAIQEAFASVLAEKDKFKAYNLSLLGLDGEALVSIQRQSETLHDTFDLLKEDFKEAGLDIQNVGDITTQNFSKIYDAVLQNNPTPETIETLNRLGDAFLTLEQKAQSAFATIDTIHAQVHGETIQAPKATDQIKTAVDQILGSGAADVLSQTIGVDWSDPTSIADWLYAAKNQPGGDWTDLSGNPLDKNEFFAKLSPYLPGLQQQIQQSQQQQSQPNGSPLGGLVPSGGGLGTEYVSTSSNQHGYVAPSAQNSTSAISSRANEVDRLIQSQKYAAMSVAEKYSSILSKLPDSVQEAIKSGNLDQLGELLKKDSTISLDNVRQAISAKKELAELEKRQAEERKRALEQVHSIEQRVLALNIYGKQEDGAEKLKTKITELAEKLGISGVTVENFASKVDALDIQSTEAARSVEELGNTLIELREQIAQERQSYWQAREESNNSYEALRKKALQQQKEFSKQFIAANNATYKSVVENTKQYLSSLQSASSTLGGMIDKLAAELGGAKYTENLFYKALSQAKEALASKEYDRYAESVKSLSNYIGFLDKKQYANAYEAHYEKAVILNELRALKSPTDIMIEQLQQINKNTQASANYASQTASNLGSVQKDIYKLVNVKLGGRDFEEIVANGIVQGIKTDNLAAVLGQSSQKLIAQLEQSSAKWDKFPIANGKMMVTADFDKDGINDIAFGIDASGRITSIDTQTANTYRTLEKSFGDVNLKEIFSGETLQAISGKDWAFAIGDSLNLINETLESLGAKIYSFGNNLYVDIDQDGVWDFRLKADATGHLQAIDQHTQDTVNAILQKFKESAAKVGVDTSNVTDVSNTEELALTNYGSGLYETANKYLNEALPNFVSIYKKYGYKNYDEILEINPQDAEKYKNYLLEAYNYAQQASDFAKKIIAADKPGGIDLKNYPSGLKPPYDTIGAVVGLVDRVKEYLHRRHIPGFATGGYTGDYPAHQIAGVVHGGEFVVNAKTTRILGLNKDNGGVFVKMLGELSAMRKEIQELRKENEELKRYTKATAENTKPLAKEDIFGGVA